MAPPDRAPWVLASLLDTVAAGLAPVAHAVVTGDGGPDVPGAADTAAVVLVLVGTTWSAALLRGLAVRVVTGGDHATLHGRRRQARDRLAAESDRDASLAGPCAASGRPASHDDAKSGNDRPWPQSVALTALDSKRRTDP
ncbi:MAG: hypothetical protein AMXMBFR64_29310 [Myxococcales bacterium]